MSCISGRNVSRSKKEFLCTVQRNGKCGEEKSLWSYLWAAVRVNYQLFSIALEKDLLTDRKQVELAKMKMLRFYLRVTRMDKVKNVSVEQPGLDDLETHWEATVWTFKEERGWIPWQMNVRDASARKENEGKTKENYWMWWKLMCCCLAWQRTSRIQYFRGRHRKQNRRSRGIWNIMHKNKTKRKTLCNFENKTGYTSRYQYPSIIFTH